MRKCAIPAITTNCLIKKRKISFGQTRLGFAMNGAHWKWMSWITLDKWRSASNVCFSGGPTTKAQRNAKSPLDTWSLMVPDDEIMKIVNYSKKKITELHAIIGERLRETDKKNHYKLTSLAEMRAWFGLLYFRAALKLNTTDTDIVWYHESSNDMFSVPVQQKRFTFLT